MKTTPLEKRTDSSAPAPPAQRYRRVGAQLLRYGVVGGVAFVVDFGLLFVLTRFGGLNYLVSAAVGFCAGLIINYQLSIRWVFETRAVADQRREFAVFTAIGVGGVLVNELIMWFGVEVLVWYYLLVKLLATGVVFFFNFSLRKLLLFSASDSRP